MLVVMVVVVVVVVLVLAAAASRRSSHARGACRLARRKLGRLLLSPPPLCFTLSARLRGIIHLGPRCNIGSEANHG
jgi:hypothetical protein